MLAVGEARRLVVRVARLTLAHAALPPLRPFDPNSKTFDRSLLTLTARRALALRRREWHAAQLRAALQCGWTVVDARSNVVARGAIDLRSTATAALDVDAVRWLGAPLVKLDVELRDGDNVATNVNAVVVIVAVGQVASIDIVVRNLSDIALPPLTLDITLAQNYHNGAQHDLAPDASVALVGQALGVQCASLAVGQRFVHRLNLVAATATRCELVVVATGVAFERAVIAHDAKDARDVDFRGSVEWARQQSVIEIREN